MCDKLFIKSSMKKSTEPEQIKTIERDISILKDVRKKLIQEYNEANEDMNKLKEEVVKHDMEVKMANYMQESSKVEI